MSEIEFVRCHCNNCGQETKHDLLQRSVVEGHDILEDDFPISWKDTYQMLQCRGCENVCLKHEYNFEPTGETTVMYYPPPVSRRLPTWRHKLPQPIRELLEEMYVALQNNSRRLALMGVRTILDLVMLEHIGDVGTFAEKLRALETQGFIAARNRETLETAIDAGSAAAHRGYQPSAEHLNAAMDIVENLLQATYHLKTLGEDLRKNTPPRA